MKYLLYFILFVVLIAYGFFYAKEHRLIRLPTPTYVACGCGGCCAGEEPKQQCLYRFNGDLLEEIIEKDKALFGSPKCEYLNCTRGIEYKYCD